MTPALTAIFSFILGSLVTGAGVCGFASWLWGRATANPDKMLGGLVRGLASQGIREVFVRTTDQAHAGWVWVDTCDLAAAIEEAMPGGRGGSPPGGFADFPGDAS